MASVLLYVTIPAVLQWCALENQQSPFYDRTAENGVSFRTHGQTNGTDVMDGQTDVKVEIVI